MNKELIVYIMVQIVCILKVVGIEKMLKQMVLFFVLQLQEIVILTCNEFKVLNISLLIHYLLEFQFSVFGSGFSILVPVPEKFNSLYSDPDSLKKKN